MADEKISLLDALTAPSDSDVLAVVDLSASATKKTTVAELRTALETGGVLADLPTETRTAGRDDLDVLDAWLFEVTGNATIERSGGAAAFGFPSSGVLGLGSGTGSAGATALRTGTALVLDASVPIVVEFRFRPMASGVYDDTEHTRLMGIARGDAAAAVALVSSDGTHLLALISGGSPTDTEPVTLPALGAGEAAYRLRLTVTPAGATLEVAIDQGAWSTLATLTATIPEETYHPYVHVSPDGGAGDRLLLVDYVRWSAARLTEDAGATPAAFVDAIPEAPITDHNALSNLTVGNPHTQYALRPAVATEATDAREFAAADDGKVIRCTSATPVTITVPEDLTPGTTVEYVQEGAGQVQVFGGGSLTLVHPAAFNPYTNEVGSSLVVTVLNATKALVRGDLAAA